MKNNLFSLLVLLLPPIVVFGPALFSQETLAYRDSARFYYRQFEWNASQWRKGEVPLWNPQENLGEPVVAEASSSVFYPAQVLFLIPGVKFSVAFVLYAAIHVYLGSIGCFFLARQIRCGHLSSLLAAIGYSLSGAVLFQTCNIVFLVGASWLPWGAWMAWRVIRSGQPLDSVFLAMFLALPVLGGDPQTAYHIGVVSFFMLICSVRSRNRDRRKVAVRGVGLLFLAAFLALGLAAIQVFPSVQATESSTRAYSENARTLWECFDQKHATTWSGIFGHPIPATHHDHLYQFSQSPWSGFELLWPNFTGEFGTKTSRWIELVTGETRAWTPSIYCGVILLALCLSGFFRRTKAVDHSWIKPVLVMFALASLGWYGLGWLIHEINYSVFGQDPAASNIGAPVGGFYWLLVVFLPGYVNFRYPAKLFVVATLCICLLASTEFQRASSAGNWRRISRWLKALFAITFIAIVGFWIGATSLNQVFDYATQNVLSEYGPFDFDQAWRAIIWALLHSAIVLILAISVINQQTTNSLRSIGLLLIALADILVANQRLVITARSSLWDRPVQLLNELVPGTKDHRVRIFRTDPMTWSTKREWIERAASNRAEQIIDYEVQTLMSRHHLANQNSELHIGLLESFRSLEDLRLATCMAWLKSYTGIRTNDSYDVQLSPDLKALASMNCAYLLVPNWGKPNLPDSEFVHRFGEQDALLIRNPYSNSRFRVVDDCTWIKPISRLPDWLANSENRALLEQKSGLMEVSNSVLVEGERTDSLNQNESRDAAKETQIEITRETNTEIDLLIRAPAGFLVMADKYDPDWAAYLEEDGRRTKVPIWQSDLIMRGIDLSGLDVNSTKEVRIHLIYEPRSIIWGAWFTVSSLLASIIAVTLGLRMSGSRRNI